MSIVSSESLGKEVPCWLKAVLLSEDKQNCNVEKWEKTLSVERDIEVTGSVFNHLYLSPQTDCEPHVVKDCAY